MGRYGIYEIIFENEYHINGNKIVLSIYCKLCTFYLKFYKLLINKVQLMTLTKIYIHEYII